MGFASPMRRIGHFAPRSAAKTKMPRESAEDQAERRAQRLRDRVVFRQTNESLVALAVDGIS
jgi:hypothetical protein